MRREGGVGGGRVNDFKFGTFVGRFKSDGAATVAVKGLNVVHLWERDREVEVKADYLTARHSGQ